MKGKSYESIVSIMRELKSNKVVTKTITNANWLVVDKVFTLIIGVFVMAIVARYLGPENYGIYNYALAFVTIFTAFSTLGLETLSVKSIVQKEEEEGTILFTSLVLRIIGGVILTSLSGILIRYIVPGDSLVHSLVLIMSVAMIFKSLEVIEYWIQAYQISKISSLIRIYAYIFSSLVKVAFVVLNGSLIHLALIYMSDAIILGIALVVAYYKNRTSHSRMKFKFEYAKNVLSRCWYLILSGLMGTLYMQIDKVMMGSMISGKEELGIYSAATQISTMWYFVPLAIVTSFKPVIMKKKLDIENNSYINSIQTLYTIVAWVGIMFGVFIILCSDSIVSILYGQDYKGATSIIIISVWAGTFATLGSARSIWLLIENMQKYTLVYTFAGLIMNVGMNFLLIPIYGGIGAAFATLLAQIANILALAFFKETRLSCTMIIKAFSPKALLNLIK